MGAEEAVAARWFNLSLIYNLRSSPFTATSLRAEKHFKFLIRYKECIGPYWPASIELRFRSPLCDLTIYTAFKA
jgi:hypothetical protein